MPDVLITENITGAPMDALCKSFNVRFEPDLWKDQAKLLESVNGCKAIIVRNQTKVTADVIKAGKSLKVIGRAGAGLDNIDVSAAKAAGVPVVSTPDQNSVSVAELTLGMMLGLCRMIPEADRDTKAGNWSRQKFVGTELLGKTLGVAGFGRIGFLVAMRAKAFGMRIIAHDTFISPDAPTVIESGAKLVPIDTLLKESDFISCHLPSTPQTRNFFNADRFGKMKQGAVLLNLARGDSVDETALIDALKSGQLAGAGLDVRAVEPPAGDSPLNQMNNVILTPHVAAFTREAQDRVVAEVCRGVSAILNS